MHLAPGSKLGVLLVISALREQVQGFPFHCYTARGQCLAVLLAREDSSRGALCALQHSTPGSASPQMQFRECLQQKDRGCAAKKSP